MTESFKQAAKMGIKLALAAGLIFWMVHEGALDLDSFAKLTTVPLFLFCSGCVFLQIFFNNLRWLALLKGQGFESTVGQTLPLSLIGMFFNFAMPGGVGGDVVKGYYLLQDHPRQKFAGAVSILMDRIMGFFVMIATAFLAILLNWQAVRGSKELYAIGLGVTGLFFGFVFFFFVSFSKVLQSSSVGRVLFEKFPGGQRLKRFYECLHSYRRAPAALASAVTFSLINQVLLVAFVYVIAQAMSVATIPVGIYFFLVPIGVVVQALPISPAGIGVGQAAFYFLFNLYLGHESQLGPTAVTAMQVMNFFWGLLGVFFYLQRRKPLPTAQES